VGVDFFGPEGFQNGFLGGDRGALPLVVRFIEMVVASCLLSVGGRIEQDLVGVVTASECLAREV